MGGLGAFWQRVLSLALVVWLAGTLIFALLRLLPGDAITAQLAQGGAGADVIAERVAQQGLDASLSVQYYRFMTGILVGDLGYSLLSGEAVAVMVGRDFQHTLALALAALIGGAVLGIALGTAWGMGYRLAGGLLQLSLSTPVYWTGTLAIYLFTAQLGLLPSAGAGRLSQLVLPVGVLAFHVSGPIGQILAASIAESRQADYIRTARGKGLSERTVIGRHILRVGLLPAISVIALQAGFLLSGTVIVETLFVRPGLGRLLLNAVIQQDYPVVQGVVMLAALIYMAVNLLADVLYPLLDPRVRV